MAYFTKLFPVLADHETGYEIFYEVKANLRGETERDYAGQAEVMLYLWHLPPQENSARISLERFSPMFTERDAFRFRHRTPQRSYRYIYPETVDLERVAYFFDYEFDGGLPDSAYVDASRAADEWFRAWQDGNRPVLKFWSAAGFVQIHYERRRAEAGVTPSRARWPICTWHVSTGPLLLPPFAHRWV